jgi:hypothetical protein
MTPGDSEVFGVVNAGSGVQADTDRNYPIGDDKPEQHECERPFLNMALIVNQEDVFTKPIGLGSLFQETILTDCL